MTTMTAQTKKIDVGVWHQYQCTGLKIAPSLAAAAHDFAYRGYRVRICLPKRPRVVNWNNDNAGMCCWEYKVRSGRKIPISFTVNRIDCWLETGNVRVVPKAAIGKVHPQLFNKRQGESFDRLANRFAPIAEQAYEYWIDVMRWITGMQSIAQMLEERQRSYRGAYLVDMQSRKRFFETPIGFTVTLGGPVVSKRSWSKVAKVLNNAPPVPVWRIYLARADQALDLDDHRRFVLDLAIACETMIRELTSQLLRQPPKDSFRKLVDGLPISRILERWEKIGFDSPKWRAIDGERKEILRLFEIRNSVIHRGQTPLHNLTRCRQLLQSAKTFLDLGETVLG